MRGNVYIYNEVDVYWSHFSQVQCELFLLKEAVKKDEFAYYHLLSGMDFPIKSQKYIHQFFEENAGKEFVDYQGVFLKNTRTLFWIELDIIIYLENIVDSLVIISLIISFVPLINRQ